MLNHSAGVVDLIGYVDAIPFVMIAGEPKRRFLNFALRETNRRRASVFAKLTRKAQSNCVTTDAQRVREAFVPRLTSYWQPHSARNQVCSVRTTTLLISKPSCQPRRDYLIKPSYLTEGGKE